MEPAVPSLWLADLEPARDPAWAARHLGWLNPAELARLDRIRRDERRAQLLAGHVLLRRLVARCSRIAATEVEIGADAQGRPSVVQPAGWRASLAHSGRWVAALIDAGDAATGVDIEFRKAGRDIETIVRAALGLDPVSRADAYRLWAQREAEFKAGPGPAGVWVATWEDHALAVCGRGAPQVAIVDLRRDVACDLAVTWTPAPRLPVSARPQ